MFGLFEKAAPVREPSEAPIRPRAVLYKHSKPVVVYDSFCTAANAIRHPVLQRAIRLIARSVQVVNWYVDADPGSGDKISSSELKDLNDLLKSPNDEMSAANLRYWMALTQAIYGRTPLKIGMGALNKPNAIYPLDAKFLRVTVDARGSISSYLYGTNDRPQVFGTKRNPRSDGYAFQIRSPGLSADPVKIDDQLLPLDSLGGPAKVIEALLLRTLATAQGHPNAKYIVTTEDELTEKQMDEVQDYIEDHETFGERSGEIIYMRGTKMQVHRLDSDLSDIHSKVPMDDMSRMIFGAFGIPISLAGLGAADSARYAGNFAEGRQSLYSDTIIPEYLVPLADGLTQALCPPGAVIKFDYDSIPALLPMRLESAAKLQDVTFLSEEEKRELIGFGPREKSDA